MGLPELIRDELKARRIPQAKVAELLGTSQASVSRRLGGVTPLRMPEVLKLAEILGVDASELVAGRISGQLKLPPP